MHLEIDPGGEYLLPFARKKLRILKQQLEANGQPEGVHFVYVDSASTVFVRALRSGNQWIDTIKIKSESGWDFVIQDQSADRKNLTTWFGTVGKPALKQQAIVTDSLGTAVPSTPLKTGSNVMFLADDKGLLEFVDKSQKPAAYALVGSVLQLMPTLFDAEDKKLASASLLTDFAHWVVTDGATQQTCNSYLAFQTVVASKKEGFFVSYDLNVFAPAPLQLTSVTQGLLLDAVLSVGQTPDSVLANYTDAFVFAYTGAGTQQIIYRMGGIDYVAGNVPAAGAPGFGRASICTKDAAHFFADFDGYFNGAPFLGPKVERFVCVRGVRNSDGTYTYSEAVAQFDSSYNTGNPARALISASDTTAYVFGCYVRSPPKGTGGGSISCVGSDGTTVAFPTYPDVASNSETFVGAVRFKGRACVAISLLLQLSAAQVLMFAFSDGSVVACTPPGAAPFTAASTLVAGSKTVAYAYLSGSALLKYLADSNGNCIALTLPPGATAIAVHGFIERAIGCRLMFTASYGGAIPRTFHHWDETGAIFNYTVPTFVNVAANAALITIPTPSSIHKMELLDKWG